MITAFLLNYFTANYLSLGSAVLWFIIDLHIFTVGFHKHLGCPFTLMNKSMWISRQVQGLSLQTGQVCGTCWAGWHTLDMSLMGRAAFPCHLFMLPCDCAESEHPNLSFLFVQASASTWGAVPSAAVSLWVVLVARIPLASSSWMCPSAPSAYTPQLPNGAQSHPLSLQLFWSGWFASPQMRPGHLSVHKIATLAMCPSSFSASPWQNWTLRPSHFQHFMCEM